MVLSSHWARICLSFSRRRSTSSTQSSCVTSGSIWRNWRRSRSTRCASARCLKMSARRCSANFARLTTLCAPNTSRRRPNRPTSRGDSAPRTEKRESKSAGKLPALLLFRGLDLGEVAFDHVIGLCLAVAGLAAATTRRAGVGRVHLLRQRVGGVLQILNCRANGVDILAFRRALHGLNLALDGRGVVGGKFIAQCAQGLFGLIDEAVGFVTRLCELASSFVLVAVLFRLLDHALHFSLGQIRRRRDGDLLRLA